MQLSARVIVCVAIAAGCDADGGLSVRAPLPPDAPAHGSSSDGSATMAGGLDDDGDGGLDDDDGDDAGDSGSPASDSGGGEGGGGAHTLVPDASRWRISDAAPDDWRSPSFDDQDWAERQAPLGNGYEVDGAWQPVGVTTYLRHGFELDDPAAIAALALRIRRDDGAAIHINGTEVARSNLPEGELTATTTAVDEVEGADGYSYFHVVPPVELLVIGHNVLAIEVHQQGAGDLVFDARLRAIAAATEVDALALQLRTSSYGGEYGPRNVGAAWIEDAEGGYVRTLAVWADERREHLVQWSAAGGPQAADAITGATASSHGTRLLEWELDDAAGVAVPPGSYVARVEFTEVNSNEGDGAGPSLSIPFELGHGATVIRPPGDARFHDLLLLVP